VNGMFWYICMMPTGIYLKHEALTMLNKMG